MDFATARTSMVDSQVRPNDVTKYSIIAALQKIERENFVPDAYRAVAYAEMPIRVTEDRTLLDARVFSKLLDALNILPGDFVLDLGCGLGYSSAIIAQLCEAVVGIEESASSVADAVENLQAADVFNVMVTQAELRVGAKAHGPYDVIVIEGGAEQIPQALVDQLKDGGRVGAIKYEDGVGMGRVGVKTNGVLSWRSVFNADAPILAGFEATRGFTFA